MRLIQLYGFFAALICCLATMAPASAEETSSKLPAVSELNGKLSFQGGSINDNADFMFGGTVTAPLSDWAGFLIDGELGVYQGSVLGGAGAHLFARDPNQYLLGLYASHHTWEDINISRLAVESEIYWDRMTIGGLAGYEWLDVPSTKGGLAVINKDDSNPFAVLDFSLYVKDNTRATIGYKFENKQSFATVGFETLLKIAKVPTSIYANGRSNFKGDDSVHVGVRFHLGGDPSKSLIRRHREDDPQAYSPAFPTLRTKAIETDAGTATDCASIVQSYEASLPDAGGGACDGSVFGGPRYKVGSCGSCSLSASEVSHGFSYTPITTSVNINQCTAQVSGCPLRNTPDACDSGTKQCRDGSLVTRDPENSCAFRACPGEGGT